MQFIFLKSNFGFKIGKMASGIYEEEDDALPQTQLYSWFSKFKVDKCLSQLKNVVDIHPQAEWLKLLKRFGVNFLMTGISLSIICVKKNATVHINIRM